MSDRIHDSNHHSESQNQASQNLFESAYNLGKQVVDDFTTEGPGLVTALTERAKAHPQETAIEAATAVAVTGLTVAAVTTESPLVIGLAGAAAVAGSMGIVGYELTREIDRRTNHKQ